jgi:hypothetical protein
VALSRHPIASYILAKCFARIVDARATPGIAWMLDSLGDAVDLRFRSADT